jgi:hypothetical protein
MPNPKLYKSSKLFIADSLAVATIEITILVFFSSVLLKTILGFPSSELAMLLSLVVFPIAGWLHAIMAMFLRCQNCNAQLYTIPPEPEPIFVGIAKSFMVEFKIHVDVLLHRDSDVHVVPWNFT